MSATYRMRLISRGHRGSVLHLYHDKDAANPWVIAFSVLQRRYTSERVKTALWRFKTRKQAAEFLKNPQVDWKSYE